MSIKRVDPDNAAKLMDAGWVYLDVRSVPEFDAGHPSGAYNIPFLHQDPEGKMSPNPEFAPTFARVFPDRDTTLVIGCHTGARSFRVATLMTGMGYINIVDMRGGYGGDKDMPGWAARGFLTERVAQTGRSWRELSLG